MNRSETKPARAAGWNWIPALLVAVVIAGCATSSGRLNRIAPGMTRDEVVSVLGKPHGVAAQGDVEYLSYNLLNKGVGDMKEFAVKIVGGRVQSFGQRSDFGPSLLVTNEPALKP